MTTLNVSDIVFQRGEGGCLIPREVVLNTLPDKPTIKIIPLTRGKLQEIQILSRSEKIDDKLKSENDVLKFGLIEPKLTDEQIIDLKPVYANAIAIQIMAASLDIAPERIEEKAKELVQEKEDELKKNL